jgi:Ni/Fe-hydrogenase subunit HybB-like protein
MPEKLHPLWYSPLLPVFFFLTAVAVGLAMVILESSASSRAFHRGLEVRLLQRLAKAIPYVLGLYVVIKLADLAASGELALLIPRDLPSGLFWLELIVGAAVPIVLFSRRSVRQSPKGLLIGAAFVIVGVMLNRFDVSLLAQRHLGTQSYLPSLGEFAISFGIISAGILAFAFVASFFPLFEAEPHVGANAPAPPASTPLGK